jgi:hypothetical protein
MRKYVWKQNGPAVRTLQLALVSKGYSLPKWGVDGDLGEETWRRIEEFAGVDSFSTQSPLPEDVTDAILAEEIPPEVQPPAGLVRIEGDPADVHGTRSWQQIDTIVLHQTGIWMTDTPKRFRTLNAHFGILATHPTPIVQVQSMTAYMWHANELNSCAIGIEINGLFPGLAKQFHAEKHTGIGPSASQIQHTRDLIVYIWNVVASHRGEVRYIVPHRCSNDTRRSDPGEVAWREIGGWAQEKLGLCCHGPGWTVGDGRPIPGEWDERPAYAKYQY